MVNFGMDFPWLLKLAAVISTTGASKRCETDRKILGGIGKRMCMILNDIFPYSALLTPPKISMLISVMSMFFLFCRLLFVTFRKHSPVILVKTYWSSVLQYFLFIFCFYFPFLVFACALIKRYALTSSSCHAK